MQRSTVGAAQMVNDLSNWSTLNSPFYFSNGQMTMLAQGESASVNEAVPFSELSDRIHSVLNREKKNANDNPVAFGVIPFNEQDPVRFIVPSCLKVASNLRSTHIPNLQRQGSILGEQSYPSPEYYKKAVREAVSRMKSGKLEKVVLSRALQVRLQHEWSAEQLLLPLIKQNPYAYNFCANISDSIETSFLVGSSPELLVSRQGPSIIANPLAGSRKRLDNEQRNEELQYHLLESEKDLNEHAVVVDAMERVLQQYCTNLHVPMLPSVISTPAMMHLSTRMEGTLNNTTTSVLKIASELHPTPAVCGQSVQAAREFIARSEPFHRGYFTGLVGWCDARGNGEWVVLIRCGKVTANSLTAYAGAGIVQGSNDAEELMETGNKMRTILAAANIDPQVATNAVETESPELEVAS